MRLLYLKYRNNKFKHPLNGFERTFRSSGSLDNKINPLSLVGVNGSGKSKLLEVLAEIFIFLHSYYDDFLSRPKDPNLEFEIEYARRVEKGWQFIQITKNAPPNSLSIKVGKDLNNLEQIIDDEKICEILPSIVGYTSGENESLSSYFQPYNNEYSEYYYNSAFEKKKKGSLPDLPHFLWLDFLMNRKVFLANSILSDDSKWQAVKDELKIESTHSFRLTVQLKPRIGPQKGIRPAPEQEVIIEKLKKCATLINEESKQRKIILDFYLSEETKRAFKQYFKSTYQLYLAFNQLDILNHVLVRNQIQAAKKLLETTGESFHVMDPFDDEKAFHLSHIWLETKNAGKIRYQDLSDGEHQFLHVFGSLLMVSPDNTLFLMDEPETHFNPQWRSAFISLMSKLLYGRYQEYMITTHSPFILSDSKRENVFIFEKNRKKIEIKKPDFQTYGAAIDNLLHMAFGISPPVALKSRKEINDLATKEDVTINEIEKKIGSYGDSTEKMALYLRLQELHEKESKKK